MSAKLADAGTVVTTNMVEKVLYKEQQADGEPLESTILTQCLAVFAIYEWLDGQNTSLVPQFPQSLLPVGIAHKEPLKYLHVSEPEPQNCCTRATKEAAAWDWDRCWCAFLWQQSEAKETIDSMLTSVRFAAGEGSMLKD